MRRKRGTRRFESTTYHGAINAPTQAQPQAQPKQEKIVAPLPESFQAAAWAVIFGMMAGALCTFILVLSAYKNGTDWWPDAILWGAIIGFVFMFLPMLWKFIEHSELLWWWLESKLAKDLNKDGSIGKPKPEPAPPVLPSEREAETLYRLALRLWGYATAQIQAAKKDGVTLKKKPWARRQPHGLSQTEHEKAVSVFVAGGLLDTPSAPTPRTVDFNYGKELIDRGMVELGFRRTNGKWYPR